MLFVPINKYVLVEKIENPVSSLVPEEFRDKLDPFTLVRVISIADDCDIDTYDSIIDKQAVVQTNGIEKIKVQGNTFLVVSEKYIVGLLEEE